MCTHGLITNVVTPTPVRERRARRDGSIIIERVCGSFRLSAACRVAFGVVCVVVVSVILFALPISFAFSISALHILVDAEGQKAELGKYAAGELAIMQSGAAGGQ